MRLIDLDDDRHTYVGSNGEYEMWSIDPDAPPIDAIPVIRCRDCKWRDTWYCTLFTPDNWFCPKGERKEK